MKTACLTVTLLLGWVSTAAAQVSQPSCLAGITPSVPTFSLSSTVGVVADYTLFCTAGLTPGSVASLNFDFFLNTTELNTGPWSLTEGSSTYPGMHGLLNVVSFTGVAFDTSKPTLSFELHGVEVDPSAWPPGFHFLEVLTISGSLTVPISNNPTQLVAVNADAPEPSTFGLGAVALAAVIFRQRKASNAGQICPASKIRFVEYR